MDNSQLTLMILRFFKTPNKRVSLSHDQAFVDYPPDQIREVVLSLKRTGFIKLIRGTSKDAVYMTTQQGNDFLKSQEKV